jgi:hypothetical protein
MKSKLNMTIAAITPAAIVGVYGQSTYSGFVEESSGGPVDAMMDDEGCVGLSDMQALEVCVDGSECIAMSSRSRIIEVDEIIRWCCVHGKKPWRTSLCI